MTHELVCRSWQVVMATPAVQFASPYQLLLACSWEQFCPSRVLSAAVRSPSISQFLLGYEENREKVALQRCLCSLPSSASFSFHIVFPCSSAMLVFGDACVRFHLQRALASIFIELVVRFHLQRACCSLPSAASLLLHLACVSFHLHLVCCSLPSSASFSFHIVFSFSCILLVFASIFIELVVRFHLQRACCSLPSAASLLLHLACVSFHLHLVCCSLPSSASFSFHLVFSFSCILLVFASIFSELVVRFLSLSLPSCLCSLPSSASLLFAPICGDGSQDAEPPDTRLQPQTAASSNHGSRAG